jgi:hypothetical protein
MQFMKAAHAIHTVDTTQGTTDTNKMHAFAFMPVTGNKGKDKCELSSSLFDSAVLVYSHLKCDSSQY